MRSGLMASAGSATRSRPPSVRGSRPRFSRRSVRRCRQGSIGKSMNVALRRQTTRSSPMRMLRRPSPPISRPYSERPSDMEHTNYIYYLGLDLGQAQDYSALTILEEQIYIGSAWADRVLYQQDYEGGVTPGWVSPSDLSPYTLAQAYDFSMQYGRPAEVPLAVRHLQRFPLGTKYGNVVSAVAKVIRSEAMRHVPAVLLVDKTGVGA